MITKERVILIGVETAENYQIFDESMEELGNLVETAGGEVISVLTQKLLRIDRKTIVGKGKMEELQELVDNEQADLVIFNHELTPGQIHTISLLIAVPIIDRVQLIMDIFALRARSKEGKLQVELAQLNYLLPRLGGQGKQLSRLGGGIGTRGPGETKLETDRRHVRDKITKVKQDIKKITAHRERNRKNRQQTELFQIGLIGYTNAGKSTILNLLTNANTYAENQLFATLDPLTKKWQLPQGLVVTLTDTVGFIQELPTQLIEAFQSTLEESNEMDLLLHVVNASSENRLEQEKTVNHLLHELHLDKLPILTIYNKMDQVNQQTFQPIHFPNVQLSAIQVNSKAILTEAIVGQIKKELSPYCYRIPAEQGKLLNKLKQQTLVVSEEYNEIENCYYLNGFAKKTFNLNG